MPDRMPDNMPEDMPEDMPDHMPEDMPDRMPNRMSEDMSDRMPEDLPVRKCINVMVGITRSKVILFKYVIITCIYNYIELFWSNLHGSFWTMLTSDFNMLHASLCSELLWAWAHALSGWARVRDIYESDKPRVIIIAGQRRVQICLIYIYIWYTQLYTCYCQNHHQCLTNPTPI